MWPHLKKCNCKVFRYSAKGQFFVLKQLSTLAGLNTVLESLYPAFAINILNPLDVLFHIVPSNMWMSRLLIWRERANPSHIIPSKWANRSLLKKIHSRTTLKIGPPTHLFYNIWDIWDSQQIAHHVTLTHFSSFIDLIPFKLISNNNRLNQSLLFWWIDNNLLEDLNKCS